jgi:RNA polymerase sigma-70 factor (ECF subfamily)
VLRVTPPVSPSAIDLAFVSLDRGAVDRARIQADVLACFDEFRDPLLRYVCSFGIGVREAEDVVQDAFVALYEHLLARKDRTNLRSWLFRVAHNLALKHRRQQQSGLARAGGLETAQHTQDAGQDPERTLIHHERQRRVVAVIRALPDRDRRCLHLRAAGLAYRDIARVLGISLGAVAKSMARAVRRLGIVVGR